MGQPLKLLTVLVARFPISVIIISALLVALSLTGAQLSLGFRTSRSDLLNPKSENNRRWAEFTQEFGEQDDVTVVVHSDDPKAVPPILDELAAQLNRQPKLFRSVFHKIDVAKLQVQGPLQRSGQPAVPPADQRFPRPVAGPACRATSPR